MHPKLLKVSKNKRSLEQLRAIFAKHRFLKRTKDLQVTGPRFLLGKSRRSLDSSSVNQLGQVRSPVRTNVNTLGSRLWLHLTDPTRLSRKSWTSTFSWWTKLVRQLLKLRRFLKKSKGSPNGMWGCIFCTKGSCTKGKKSKSISRKALLN